MGKLTNAKVKALTAPGFYNDSPTLYLNIAPLRDGGFGGTKSWVQRIAIDGRRCDLGLGGWPVVSLAEAREVAFDNRRKVRRGEDPREEKRRAKLERTKPTFRAAAEATRKAKAPGWKTERASDIWWSRLERRAFPMLANHRVDKIGREHVLKVLTPIWQTLPAEARKLRQGIRDVLGWAAAHGYVDRNMAGDVIDGALGKQPTGGNFTALPYADLPEAFATFDGAGEPVVAAALRLVVLTACRHGEVREARWSEFDFDKAMWTIPADRTKTGKEHRVPLTPAMVDVLAERRDHTGGEGLVFPSPRSTTKALPSQTINLGLARLGLKGRATIHGFRSTFRDWCAETGKNQEDAEAALAHAKGAVEGAYFRSDLFERRRGLMERWSAFVTGTESKVVALRG